jgi:hypothetical protein
VVVVKKLQKNHEKGKLLKIANAQNCKKGKETDV